MAKTSNDVLTLPARCNECRLYRTERSLPIYVSVPGEAGFCVREGGVCEVVKRKTKLKTARPQVGERGKKA